MSVYKHLIVKLVVFLALLKTKIQLEIVNKLLLIIDFIVHIEITFENGPTGLMTYVCQTCQHLEHSYTTQFPQQQ